MKARKIILKVFSSFISWFSIFTFLMFGSFFIGCGDCGLPSTWEGIPVIKCWGNEDYECCTYENITCNEDHDCIGCRVKVCNDECNGPELRNKKCYY